MNHAKPAPLQKAIIIFLSKVIIGVHLTVASCTPNNQLLKVSWRNSKIWTCPTQNTIDFSWLETRSRADGPSSLLTLIFLLLIFI